MVKVIANFAVKEDLVDLFLDIARKLVDQSIKETCNIFYEMF